jgi:hypothetical protein
MAPVASSIVVVLVATLNHVQVTCLRLGAYPLHDPAVSVSFCHLALLCWQARARLANTRGKKAKRKVRAPYVMPLFPFAVSPANLSEA